MARARRKVAVRANALREGTLANPWTDVGRDGRSLHIGHFVTFQVMRLANAAKANVTRRYLGKFALSIPEWRLLAMTIRYEPVRFSVLVANSSIDKGQASRTLQALARRGLIKVQTFGGRVRKAGRSRDGGAPVVLTLTPKGRRLYSTVIPVARRNQARLLHLLSRNERRALYVILNKLFAAIGDRDAFI
jgi:DNA-binding MarR family transcriptional regulator